MLVGQIEHEEPLSRDVEHMNPHEVVEHPACRRVLDALAFLVWKRRPVLLQRRRTVQIRAHQIAGTG